MRNKNAGLSCYTFVILMLLVLRVPVFAQYTDNLGGNWNNPAGAMITNIIMDRYARRRLEKNLAAKHSSTGATTGTVYLRDESIA